MVSPETWYVLWALAFVALIAGLAWLRSYIGREYRRHCGDEPSSEEVVAAGNKLYEGLTRHGVETPSDFQGFKVARDVLDVRRQQWDNQKVAIFVGAAFVVGLSVGLAF